MKFWVAFAVAVWPGLAFAQVHSAACTASYQTVAVTNANRNLDRQFDAAARRYHIDPDLGRAITQVESSFNPFAVSPKGAQGLMQLMPATGIAMGVTNPFEAAQSILGGMGYLRRLIDDPRFARDPYMALVAYNAGPNRTSFPPESYHYADAVLAVFLQLKQHMLRHVGLIAPHPPDYFSLHVCDHTTTAKPRLGADGKLLPTRHYAMVGSTG